MDDAVNPAVTGSFGHQAIGKIAPTVSHCQKEVEDHPFKPLRRKLVEQGNQFVAQSSVEECRGGFHSVQGSLTLINRRDVYRHFSANRTFSASPRMFCLPRLLNPFCEARELGKRFIVDTFGIGREDLSSQLCDDVQIAARGNKEARLGEIRSRPMCPTLQDGGITTARNKLGGFLIGYVELLLKGGKASRNIWCTLCEEAQDRKHQRFVIWNWHGRSPNRRVCHYLPYPDRVKKPLKAAGSEAVKKTANMRAPDLARSGRSVPHGPVWENCSFVWTVGAPGRTRTSTPCGNRF